MSRSEFIAVAIELLRDSCNGMDDVRAAFRVFDHNNDGTISKEELQEDAQLWHPRDGGVSIPDR